MTFNKEQAEKIGAIFGFSNEAVAWLQIASYQRVSAGHRPRRSSDFAREPNDIVSSPI
jgi:hypothetical protein